MGNWSIAIEVAEIQDRMNLKTTYYNYASHVESIGEFTAAINQWEDWLWVLVSVLLQLRDEKSDTHHLKFTRMLLDEPDELQEFIMKGKDKYIQCDNVFPPM